MKTKIFEMRTKTRTTILLVILFILVCQPAAMGMWVGINSVDVIPNQPKALEIDNVDVIPNQLSETDVITFNISGWATARPSWVGYDQFSQIGTSLQLDLYISVGILPATSNWTYSRQISPLSPEVYSLQVRAFDNYYGTLWDTYNVSFTVVPEPGTLVIFAFALPFFRDFVKKGTVSRRSLNP
jgi:hypothetical protein